MRISIITATFNSQDFVADAIQSYKQQSFADKELVVIDGKSIDGTLDILTQYTNDIDTLVSEEDRGIYDALNKGVGLAEGEIIGILHSDDFLAHKHILAQVHQKFINDPTLEAVYGDLQYVDRQSPDKVIRNWVSGGYDIRNFRKGWMPPHPALFIKKSCFAKFGNYNLDYKSASDYDLILRFLFKHRIKTAYIPEVLVKMRVGGLSNKSFSNRIKANKEDRVALKQNGVPHALFVSIIKPLSKIRQFWIKNI